MNKPSEEQRIILNHIKNGVNIHVQAVAGSGKSTTVFSIAHEYTDKSILLLTYNASLRLETKERARNFGLDNIDVHTFHSLGVNYYTENAHTDTGLRQTLLYKFSPLKPIKPFDIVVIDENQDMTQLYFMFVVKFLLDYGKKVQLVCLGDVRQCIYDFKGADQRFLSMCPQLWSSFWYLRTSEFVQCDLKMSYRITDQMGRFVNECLYDQHIMNSCRAGPNITYIRNSRQNAEKTVIYSIKKLLSTGVKFDDIFILAASVKGVNGHVRKLENRLVEENIPCFVPIFETGKLDERVIGGKIVFSTFHSVKGRQRKYVFLIGFDNNYFEHFARGIDKELCPNTIYVGCTRAIEQLFLVEYDHFPNDRPFEFLKKTHHDLVNSDYVDFKGIPGSIFKRHESFDYSSVKHFESPTKLVQFINEDVLYDITPIIDTVYVKTDSPEYIIDIPSVVETEYGFEDVSDLNGIAIPFLFYEKMCQNNLLNNMIDVCVKELKKSDYAFLHNLVKELPEKCGSIEDYLFMSNILTSIQEKLYFKLKQIKKHNYNWLSYSIVSHCLDRLELLVDVSDKESLQFEHQIINYNSDELHKKIDAHLKPFFVNKEFRFSAIIDVMNKDTIYELKCTNSITIEHKIQLILYAFLWQVCELPRKEFILINIKTGEKMELNASLDQLTQIIVRILQGKYEEVEKKHDTDFLKENVELMNKLTSAQLMDRILKAIDVDDTSQDDYIDCHS